MICFFGGGGGRFGCQGFGCDLISPDKKGWFEDVKSETVSKFSVIYIYIYIWIFQVCKICAFSPEKPTKRQMFTYLEDPGIITCRNDCVTTVFSYIPSAFLS